MSLRKYLMPSDISPSEAFKATEVPNTPLAQPEQRTGKWIPSDSQCGIRCSVCGAPVDDFCHSIDYIDLVYEPNFCPNCGAKMEGDAE